MDEEFAVKNEKEFSDGNEGVAAGGRRNATVGNRIGNAAIVILLIAVLISMSWIGLRAFVFERYEVKGISMSPTLSEGDWLWANKLKAAERYSVVSVKAEVYIERANRQLQENGENLMKETPEILLKRVIGVEGDILSVVNRRIKIECADGTVIMLDKEDYGGGELAALSYWLYGKREWSAKTEPIPAGYVFILGDMRGNSGASISIDSRMFGLVAVEDIIAVVYGYTKVS